MDKFILDSIFFSYGNRQILQGAFMESKKGTVTGLIGKNGTGKSTLFKIAAGQLQAESGITIILERRLHKKSNRFRFSKLAYLPQESFLPDAIKVKDITSSFPELSEMNF